MMTPIEEKKDEKVRIGMVQVSDGKSRPRPARLVLTVDAITVQQEVPVQPPIIDKTGPHPRERMVQIRRQKVGGLGLSIKGGAEHKLPILISKIYQGQAADQTGQLFVGDAVIKVNGEYITACAHDDAVSILRTAGDLVVLTVRHYRAAAPFLLKHADGASDTDSSTGDDHPSLSHKPKVDDNCNGDTPAEPELSSTPHSNGGWQRAWSDEEGRSRPPSVASADTEWRDIVTVPLMMAYVTRYVMGTDKLRPGAFEVRGASPQLTTGVIHLSEPAALSQWLKDVSDNVVGLTNLQVKVLNRQLRAEERIEYMGWVAEGEAGARGWHRYTPRFLLLRGTELLLYSQPPTSVSAMCGAAERLKVYQTLFRTVKESETVDWRQHCFLIQASGGLGAGAGGQPRYFSLETRAELVRLEAAWTAALVRAVLRLGKKTFTVVHGGRAAGLTLDWAQGFSLADGPAAPPLWAYRFSQLRGSSDDGKSKLKLHFQDAETKVIETKELECQILQSLLFCMHAFLTAKVASVDPAFLASIHHNN